VHILTLGDITNEDLPYLYSAADCVVLTSISEGSPTVIKEARACGCPVVSVDVGDVAEQLEGYPYGMVTKTRDPEEIAKRVAQMLVEQRPQPTSADLEKLSIETTGKRLLGVYRSVLGY
jgi:glycosyltransferase involved in cell wall biosynthesis